MNHETARPGIESPATVLVVEDEEVLRRNLALLLQLEGYEVVSAANGCLALEAIRQRRPDLVLCDRMMPDLDGFGLLRALREDPETAATPLLFLSARGGAVECGEAESLGADGYLTKPVVREDLLAALAARLGRGKGEPPERTQIPIEPAPARPAVRESLAVLLTGTDILRHHSASLSESQLQDQRDAMLDAGAKLSEALAAGGEAE
jgi:DNA-binding response OmpR family regulator